MKYVVIELQSSDGNVANIVTSHDTLDEAKSKYHLVLSAAAVSSLASHSATLLDSEGQPLAYECFRH